MLKWYIIGLTLGIELLLGSNTLAEPPMVQKHIFSPRLDMEQRKVLSSATVEQEKPTIDPKLKQEILFTGVIVGPKGKIALCRETKENNNRLQKREGDTILGFTVKRIEPNYLLLADSDGKEMRLNLYQSNRKRPDAPQVPQPIQQLQMIPPTATGHQQSTMPQRGWPFGAEKVGGLSGPANIPTGAAGQPHAQIDAHVRPMSEAEKENTLWIDSLKQAMNKAKQNHAADVVNPSEAPVNPFQQAIQKEIKP